MKFLLIFNNNRWLSEKMDGVRAYWNGRCMISRYGKKISCPLWFLEGLPGNLTLDGELWLGRGNYEMLNSILLSSKESPLWKNISYVVFDLPSSKEPYEMRLQYLTNLKLPQHVNVVDIVECKGNDHLLLYLAEKMQQGAEGLMANKPLSLYVSRRTDTILKVKVRISCFLLKLKPRQDTEVQLLEVLPTGLYCLQ
jgi:DNA ligase-1